MSIYCSRCGAMNSDSAKFCKKCGHPLNEPVNEQQQQMNNNYGNNRVDNGYENNHESNDDDKPNLGFNILAVLIPLIGYILYFCWRNNTPNKAKSILIWSVVGSVVGFILIYS